MTVVGGELTFIAKMSVEKVKRPRGRPPKYATPKQVVMANSFLRWCRREKKKFQEGKRPEYSINCLVDLCMEESAMNALVTKRGKARDRKRAQRDNPDFREKEKEARRLRVDAVERLRKADLKAFEKAEREGKRMASRAFK